MSNISILLFFFGLKTTMYQPTPVSQGWILSQQTAAKCLLSPWKQLYVTSGASIYVTFYKNSLKVGCSVCWIISNVRSLDEKDIYENRCSVCCVFVGDRKSELASDRVSTCCSWQAEQVGLTRFDWCLLEWRRPMVSSFLVCWGFGSSLLTNPGRHKNTRVKS